MTAAAINMSQIVVIEIGSISRRRALTLFDSPASRTAVIGFTLPLAGQEHLVVTLQKRT